MRNLFKLVVLSLMLFGLTGCYKNSYQTCIDYWEAQAKEERPTDWKKLASSYVRNFCQGVN